MENLGRWSYDRIKGLKKYKSYFSDKSKNGACQSAETETRTPTAPSTPVQPFPLLRLPREIRDEVYKYFVLIDAPIEFETLRIFRIFPPALDLSIFRVNKQIHDEASGIFYSQNTFPIKLAINRTRSPGSPLYAYGFTVKYIAYWEEFTFHFRTDEPEMVYGPNCRIGQRDKVIAEDDIVLFPAPRYRHLLRRVRIAVLDNRKWRRSKPFDLKTYEDLRALGRTILIPLASRLNTVMADSGENLTVIIEVENRLASKEASVERWLEDETIENWRLAHFKPRRDPKVKMSGIEDGEALSVTGRTGVGRRPHFTVDFRPLLQHNLNTNLASALLLLHSSKWLHKNICSQNIIFFKPRSRGSPRFDMSHFREPYLTGFSHSRPDNPGEASMERPRADQLDFYRHPDFQKGHSRLNDIYSLGVVLFEISEWKSMKKLRDENKRHGLELKDEADVRSFLLKHCGAGKRLRGRMGDVYASVVLLCLNGDLGKAVDAQDDDSLIKEFWSRVVRELDSCRA
ncbi:prion-inhibition and propagation-domain-containing protein [Drechslerella dactyloides]|uniref:Prion-inhibition and propagation-domain-containing protein n=1 Tax=Drechslerella dactyloides TaxID=74499 RepID=A0AAD6NFI2_DREDA|nr:prion-inhibition and propagation-domain-containing protein [Drechslerella dactyloides]